jgi:membrane fusion protein (multidrug efflux system)
MIGYRPSAFGSALVSSFLLVALLGCQRHEESAAQTGPPSMEVAVTTVSPRSLRVSFDAVGQTAGSREVEVRARVGGILQEQPYTEGAWVKAGTVLFKIDPAPY